MAQNRKISQFASYVAYDDVTTHIAITTTSSAPFVGIGSTVPEQKLTVAGNTYITGFVSATTYYNGNGVCIEDLYQLDNISGGSSGLDNTFTPTFNQSTVSLDYRAPFKLSITVNGTFQSTFVYNTEYVWQNNLLCAYDGFTIDYDGNVKFTEPLPEGSQVAIRVNSGAVKSDFRRYPFRALDVVF